MAKHKVLSTKKLEPSLVEKAKENGVEIIEQEFISVRPALHKKTFTQIAALAKAGKLDVVFTSANAVNVLDRYVVAEREYQLISYRFFCLSGKTKQAIENAKLLKGDIISEGASATALAQKIIESGIKEIVFFCGDKRRDELPRMLHDAGVTVHEIVVYETIETPKTVTEGVDAVLFFSPSAVQSFFSANQLTKNTACFAIGETTANAVANFTGNRIIVCQSPTQEMMMTTVNFYFQNINCTTKNGYSNKK